MNFQKQTGILKIQLFEIEYAVPSKIFYLKL
jgi:hypothetical protein